ncbi:MAG: NAD(P)H-dependent oxidoreductase [Acidimicrobiales bacterium]
MSIRTLLIDGHDPDRPAPMVAALAGELGGRGHEVSRLDLAAAGFDRTMSPAEREAYPSRHPLVTPETRAAADQVKAATRLVICYPLVHGTCPVRVKSWQERVLVEGVGFRFLASGRIAGALEHLSDTLVVASTPNGVGDRRDRAVLGQGRSLARAFRLMSNRHCRSDFVITAPDDPAPALAVLRTW